MIPAVKGGTLFGGYCATVQGLLGRFEVENVLAKFLFYLNRFESVYMVGPGG